MASNSSLRSLARILLIVGGIVLILGSVLEVGADLRGFIDLAPRLPSLGVLTGAIIGILVGILALIGAGQGSSPAWSIILLVLGFLVQGLGGILVFIGALIALVTALVKT